MHPDSDESPEQIQDEHLFVAGSHVCMVLGFNRLQSSLFFCFDGSKGGSGGAFVVDGMLLKVIYAINNNKNTKNKTTLFIYILFI
jgi:hypothetical protein